MAVDVTVTIKDFKRWPEDSPQGHLVVFAVAVEDCDATPTASSCVLFAESQGLTPEDIVDRAYARVKDDLRAQVLVCQAASALVGKVYDKADAMLYKAKGG